MNWQYQQATCPEGHTSSSWTPATTDGGRCPRQAHCIRSAKKYKRRTITVRPQAQLEALTLARQRQRTCAFTRQYALREGVEATISQGVRAFGVRRTRSIGLMKTHLQHVGIAAAMNVALLIDWLEGTGPASTQLLAFQRLFSAA